MDCYYCAREGEPGIEATYSVADEMYHKRPTLVPACRTCADQAFSDGDEKVFDVTGREVTRAEWRAGLR